MRGELLFVAQGLGVVLVVVLHHVEAAVAVRLIKSDGGRVVGTHFQAQGHAVPIQRGLLAGVEQTVPEPLALTGRVDRKRIQPAQRRAGIAQHHAVAAHDTVGRGDQRGRVAAREQVTKTTPAQAVAVETALLDVQQGIQVVQRGGADHRRAAYHGQGQSEL